MPAFGRPHAKYRNLTDDEIDQLTERSIDDVLFDEYKEQVRQDHFAIVARLFTGYDDLDSRSMPYGGKTATEVITEAMKRTS